MNEPLVSWTFLIVVLVWGSCTRSIEYQQGLTRKCGKFAPFLQWYFVAGFCLLLFFTRTLWDVIRFEYIHMNFLNPDQYKEQHLDPDKTHIGLSHDEQYGNVLTIPSFLRWISLLSPIAGLFTFGLASYSTVQHILAHETVVERGMEFLRTVVVGMPLVFVAMSLRATIREWAVMTGTAWTADCQGQAPAVCQGMWEDIKAAEIATYEQDLQVASAFQFFAVGCFGQVCKEALKVMVNNNNINNNDDQLSDDVRNRRRRDSSILRQLAVLGLGAFVALGIVKTVVNIIIAMISSDPDNLPVIEPIQTKIIKILDPVFLCATVLSVVNMFLLAQIEEVKAVLPGANTKFNATRALLLIGQGQLSVLRAFDTSKGSPAVNALQHFNIIQGDTVYFGIHQIRLLHSSLLCFECLIVAILNHIVWMDKKVGNKDLEQPLNP